jgi:multisubunit Na+/H+ antiporter MnhE subunit
MGCHIAVRMAFQADLARPEQSCEIQAAPGTQWVDVDPDAHSR